ncbi:hypothetical protein I4F81_000393 [Pyropia yezoensis]|uniref:Uncharacterized protein n=1 Tax=Pyropia yezoensis TaxID=2788 RepID=A0ACC3BJM2_PYRYE|nr:hypothetical protein I4F81_000393 [Neopyropia yezoensis]
MDALRGGAAAAAAPRGVRVVSLDGAVSRLRVAVTDPAGRVHPLAVTIPPTYPAGPGAVTVDVDGGVPAVLAPPPLPLPLCPPRPGGALGAALGAAVAAVSSPAAQLFWAVMDDLDAWCHVLDPPPAAAAARRRSVPYRRLALDADAATAAVAAASDADMDGVVDGGGGAARRFRRAASCPLLPATDG